MYLYIYVNMYVYVCINAICPVPCASWDNFKSTGRAEKRCRALLPGRTQQPPCNTCMARVSKGFKTCDTLELQSCVLELKDDMTS